MNSSGSTLNFHSYKKSTSASALRLTFNICALSTLSLWIPLFMFSICFGGNISFMGIGVILFFGFLVLFPFIGMGLYLLKRMGVGQEDISLLCILTAWILSQAMGILFFDLGLKHTLFALILGGCAHFSLWLTFRESSLSATSPIATREASTPIPQEPHLHTEKTPEQGLCTEENTATDTKEPFTYGSMYVL